MFNDRHYVPAIRWRQGEFSALQELRAEQRKNVTPLVDIPPIPWDFKTDQPARTPDYHLRDVPEQMANIWGSDAPIFVDCGLLDPQIRMDAEEHPVDHLFDVLDSKGVKAIPVTGIDRDDEYQSAIGRVAAFDRRGLCIRARPDELEQEDFADVFLDIASDADLTINDLDLIIDFRAIDGSQITLLRRLIVSTINSLTDVDGYRTLTLLTGSAPQNMTNVPNGVSLVPRSDWALWQAVRAAGPARQPAYGDYTAVPADQEEIDPRIMTSSANIRYAAEDDWIIARGRSLRSPRYGKFSQYNSLSKQLTEHEQYEGNGFSWGDNFIDACADGGPTGSLMTWKKVAVNRHIAVAGRQISNLGEP